VIRRTSRSVDLYAAIDRAHAAVNSNPGGAPAIPETPSMSGTAQVQPYKIGPSMAASVPFDLTQFFNGRTLAWGIFEDRFGRLRRRFSGQFDGCWVGDDFVLAETFTFDDGAVESRIWRLKRAVDGGFTAATDDCIGKPVCTVKRNSSRMQYGFRLRMKNRVVPVALDDRIHRIDEGRAMNRAKVSKWGVKIGELSIFFLRTDAPEPG
jgi:hypothetical protein